MDLSFKNLFKRQDKRVKTFVKVDSGRAFEGANSDRLNFGWITSPENINQEISKSLQILKTRSRYLVQNSSVINSFINVITKNVIGSEGISLRNKAINDRGDLDIYDNAQIERVWKEFSKAPTISGQDTLKELLKQILVSLKIDGEAVLIIHEGFSNQFAIGIELVDSVLLDPQLNLEGTNGNKIICGIEFDSFKRPQNYYFKTPTSYNQVVSTYTKVPASKVIHLFEKRIMGQVRGIPAVSPVLGDLKTLDAYITAEVVAARVSASNMGFIETSENAPSEYEGEGVDENGNPVTTLEPGIIATLGRGQKFSAFNSQHPNSVFPEFVKGIQKQISSCLGISYGYLYNDFSDANYSSMRAAALSDREGFKVLQDMLIEKVLVPVFDKWISIQTLNGNLTFPIQKLPLKNKPVFVPKRWQWVDPTKDIEAAKTALEIGVTTKTRILAEQGIDVADLANELKAEEQIFGKLIQIKEEKPNGKPTDKPSN